MGKNARKKFSNNTRIVYPKIVGKKSSQKSPKNVFYKHMNIETINGGKKRENFFPKTHVNREKKRWKKIVWKKCENTFFYENTNIVTKKWGGKSREKIFPETHVYCEF